MFKNVCIKEMGQLLQLLIIQEHSQIKLDLTQTKSFIHMELMDTEEVTLEKILENSLK